MKILIIGFAKLKYMPYMNFYLENINTSKNEVHLVYWNRDNEQDKELSEDIILHEYKYYQEDDKPKIGKLKAFMGFRQFAKEIISKNQFDFVIVLQTLPAVLLCDKLTGKFSGRYILDYRDYTYEKIYLYKRIIAKLVRHSLYTFVSSDAFRKYLPDLDKVKTTHNILLDSLEQRNIRDPFQNVIRIRYWGMIRYSKTQIEIIRQIANDSRFEFHFNGREQGECGLIKEYVKENKINNVFFHGEYLPEDRFDFIKYTDIIQNIQDFDSVTENAVSNKFYDGPLFYIPQICSDKSYMGKCLEKYGIGLPFNMDEDNFADKLYNYIMNLDVDTFTVNCDKFIDKVLNEYNNDIEVLNAIFG